MTDPKNPSGSYTPKSIEKSGAGGALGPVAETAAMVLAAQAKALVEARFTIAQYHPRDIDAVRQKLMRECERPSFAEVAIYYKPIGKGIEGPSIRFAEAAMQAMGNLAIETPAVYDDSEKRIVRVIVADMETNVVHSKDVTILKRVERSRLGDGQVPIKQRTNSSGKPVYIVEATDDEILNQENALVSKALRTTGLRLVPGWLIDECMTAVRATRKRDDAADPDAAKRKLLDAFRAVGVTAEQIKEWLGHPADTITPAELDELRGIYTSLKDSDTTWVEVMDARWEKALDGMGQRAARAAGAASGQPASTPQAGTSAGPAAPGPAQAAGGSNPTPPAGSGAPTGAQAGPGGAPQASSDAPPAGGRRGPGAVKAAIRGQTGSLPGVGGPPPASPPPQGKPSDLSPVPPAAAAPPPERDPDFDEPEPGANG